jgi:hypothetical protein
MKEKGDLLLVQGYLPFSLVLKAGEANAEEDQAEEEVPAEGIVDDLPQPVRDTEKGSLLHVTPLREILE